MIARAGETVKKMKKSDRYTSVIYAAFGLYIAFEGYRLELGTFRAPKPGFMVFLAGITLWMLSMVQLILSFPAGKTEKQTTWWKDRQWQKVVKLTAALLLYASVLRWLGFLLSTILLLFVLFKGIEPQRWQVALGFSLITSVTCYLVFGVFFELRFPEGILETILIRMFS